MKDSQFALILGWLILITSHLESNKFLSGVLAGFAVILFMAGVIFSIIDIRDKE